MTYEISTPLILKHQNLVPGTEHISVDQSSVQFFKGTDYTIDYLKGEVRFLSDGVAITIGELIETNGLNVSYNYQVIINQSTFESQKEVNGESPSIIRDGVFSVSNSPITDISRVVNITTGEEYKVLSIDLNRIYYSFNSVPQTEKLIFNTQYIESKIIPERGVFNNKSIVIYNSKYTKNNNKILSVSLIDSKSPFRRKIASGQTDNLTQQFIFDVSYQTSQIRVFTGGSTSRTSNYLLNKNDYNYLVDVVKGSVDYKTLKLSLTTSGIQKIRTNNVYVDFIYNENPTIEESQDTYFVNSDFYYINEVVNFSTNTQSLKKLYNNINSEQNIDLIIFPTIQVIGLYSGIEYDSTNYKIDYTAKTITRTSAENINEPVVVCYIDKPNSIYSFNIIADIVVVDYVWGTNSLNWNASRKVIPIYENHKLYFGQQSIVLSEIPIDYKQIKIYLADDTTQKNQSSALSYNSDANRILIEKISVESNYIVEYNCYEQPIKQGTPYFVSYKYGATKNEIKNRYSKLVNLQDSTIYRIDTFSMAAGQIKVQLTNYPTSTNDILIYQADDILQLPISSVIQYKQETNEITFTPINQSGRVCVKYLTTGFDTNGLRVATQKLFENFTIGPTEAGYKNIISGFTTLEPTIELQNQYRFIVADSKHTTGSTIDSKIIESATPISYTPAKFNLGGLFETSKQNFLKVPSTENINLEEGTIEFLTGTLFESTDNNFHYFFDIGGADLTRNRICLYKKDKYLIFEVRDSNQNIYRAISDVQQYFYTEIIYLESQASSAKLTNKPFYTSIDYNNNQTPDLYETFLTKFIIMPESSIYPPAFKQSVKVLSFDPIENVVNFEPVDYHGNYVFSYIGGLIKNEQTDNFVAVCWKLHTLDGEPSFYRLYINGRIVINQTLSQIEFATTDDNYSRYDSAIYNQNKYENN